MEVNSFSGTNRNQWYNQTNQIIVYICVYHLPELFKWPIEPTGCYAEVRFMRCNMMYSMMTSW